MGLGGWLHSVYEYRMLNSVPVYVVACGKGNTNRRDFSFTNTVHVLCEYE